MTYCEAFFLKNLQSLMATSDTFRKQLLSMRHSSYLVQGLLVTLSNKMEDMLRRRNNTPKAPVISTALQMLNAGNQPRNLADGQNATPLPPSGVLQTRNQSESLDNIFLCNGNLLRAPGTPPRHMLIPGTLPRKPEIPPPAIPKCEHSTPPVVPPPR